MILHRKQEATESEELAGKTVWRINFENLEEAQISRISTDCVQ